MERALITRMFLDDLKIAGEFAKCGLTGQARQHVQSALAKLDQLEALPEGNPKAQPPAIEV